MKSRALKYQLMSDEVAAIAVRMLPKTLVFAHLRSAIVVELASKAHVDDVTSCMSALGAHTVGLSTYDIQSIS